MKFLRVRRHQYAPEVETKLGKIRGRRIRSQGGRKLFSFTRIPYAKPPVGKLRFCRSSPVEPWTTTLKATKKSKPCIQPNFFYPTSSLRLGSEDCLYLNVFTADISDKANLQPVIVFIHGGAFVVGSNDDRIYGPSVLLDQDVVLVCINYRLGPLGFLSLETDSSPGNLGLHDQYLALLWVKENISAFGGDPDNVTLMGESAGAMSALLHTVSPFSKDLFHKVIALSGSPSTVFLKQNRSPRLYAKALAEKLGCDEEDPEKILHFFQNQPLKRILKYSIMFMDWDYAIPIPWLPISDRFASNPFLPESFHESLQQNVVSSKPVLFCMCKDEGLFLTAPFYRHKERAQILDENWLEWAPLLFLHKERDLCTEQDLDAAAKIREYYFKEDSVKHDKKSLDTIKEIYSMTFFKYPIIKDALAMQAKDWNVWVMQLCVPAQFSILHAARMSFGKFLMKMTARSCGFQQLQKQYGVCHGDDLFFLFPFKIPGFPATIKTLDQQFARATMVENVCEFATSSQPKSAAVNESTSDSSNKASIEIIEILPDKTIKTTPIEETDMSSDLKFWEEIFSMDENRTYSDKEVSKLYKTIVPFRDE